MKPQLAVLFALLVAAGAPAQEPADFDAHEWGTFTTITLGDGRMLDWQPLDGPSDLPAFVYEAGRGGKFDFAGTVRMETPVIYFHAKRPFSVDVEVRFPLGRVTEWYPQATARDAPGRKISWKGLEVLPGEQLPLPEGDGAGHYFAARATSAAPVRMVFPDRAECEKYIFYRGVGSPKLPVEVRLEGERIRVKALVDEPVKYIVFENDGTHSAYGIYAAFGEKNDMPVLRPILGGVRWGDLDHLGGLEKLLLEEGLHPDEAKAMIATWRDDWFEPGLRVFWIVPRTVIDKVLPLRFAPEPGKVVRAFVGRVEILTGDYVARVEHAAEDLLDGRPGRLEAAGRFQGPVLAALAQRTELPALKQAIVRYMQDRSERGPAGEPEAVSTGSGGNTR